MDAAPKETPPEPKPTEPKAAEVKPAEAAPTGKPAKEAPKPDAIPEQLVTGEKPKPTEPSHDDILDAEPPANLSEKGKVSWRLMRERSKTIALERDNLRKELETAKASGAPKAEIESIQAEVKAARERAAELEKVIEREAFQQSPRFQQFLTREKAALDAAKGYLEGSEINPNVIDLAAAAKGAQRLKILRDAQMEPDMIAAVAPQLARLDEIQQAKAEALATSKQLAEQWSADEKRAAAERDAAARTEEERVFAQVGAEVAQKFAPFQKIDGHDAWNAGVEQRLADAREFMFGNLPVEKIAEIAYAGVAYKVVDQINATLREKLNAANARLAKYEAAQPGSGNGTGDDKPAQTFANATEAATARFREAMGR